MNILGRFLLLRYVSIGVPCRDEALLRSGTEVGCEMSSQRPRRTLTYTVILLPLKRVNVNPSKSSAYVSR